jgi:hypothetical protein
VHGASVHGSPSQHHKRTTNINFDRCRIDCRTVSISASGFCERSNKFRSRSHGECSKNLKDLNIPRINSEIGAKESVRPAAYNAPWSRERLSAAPRGGWQGTAIRLIPSNKFRNRSHGECGTCRVQPSLVYLVSVSLLPGAGDRVQRINRVQPSLVYLVCVSLLPGAGDRVQRIG